MKAIIIEDEQSAEENLRILLESVAPYIQIIGSIETVTDAIDFFKENNAFDLVFMDIHLADGISFEILSEVEPSTPIIFTTAYDQYAIQAFKLNSIDYLLKPIQEADLQNAIRKFKDQHIKPYFPVEQIEALMRMTDVRKKRFRGSFLVQKKDSFIPIASTEFAYFFIQDGIVRGTTKDGRIYSLNETLEDLEKELNPEEFFRANRQYLIQRSVIQSLETYFNSRLMLKLHPQAKEQVIVSKANSSRLKEWLKSAKSIG